MTLNNKVVKKIWKESISTLIIVTLIIITIGHVKSLSPVIITTTPESIALDAGELPSENNTSIPPIIEESVLEKISIDQLVDDVETGKAGNGDDRVLYLGEYYDEVQNIINERYQKNRSIPVSSRSGTISRATYGDKAKYQSYAYDLVIANGWSESDFNSLIYLWEKESGWNPNSHNESSGAHGIPQSLPASKMSSHGEDYYYNGHTQIRWGLEYIRNRYGSPTAAWNHFCAKNWY